MTPEENFKFINSYLARITPIIRENNGFIDKYIGDAILALYPGSPEDALRSAIRMVEYLSEYNGYRKNSGYRPINIGIGIHTGTLIVGIIGDTERMQGTVISDAVNLASRVQDVTKLYGANIIISQDTFIRLENPTIYNFRFLGKVKVKGKVQSVSLFEVFDGESPERIALKGRTKQEFEDAILRFSQRKFADASEAFRKIIEQNPKDRAAALFYNRAELFLKREKTSWLLK
jgi:two-component system sensor histidine kinase ChiS